VRTAIVIPAYNEAAAVGAVVAQALLLGDVVVVDDASTDTTGAVAQAAGATVVRHVENRGYDGALASGFDAAIALGVDAVLTMDADGQHSPESGRAFLDCLKNGSADIVIGRRPAKARWSEHVFALYTRVRFGLPDPLCGMKAYRADLVTRHRSALDRSTIGAGLAVAALASGARLTVIDIPVRPRVGSSRFGAGLKANFRILAGLAAAISIDARSKRRSQATKTA
jgi:glycosyltransferase involved in cell wall biosynthesis